MTLAIEMTAERNKNITNTIKSISNRLFGFIKQRVASTEDAEDILQEVFYQFAGNTEPIEQATGWLYKVARNKITDNYRKHKLPLADDIFSNAEGDDENFNWKEMLLPSDATPETEIEGVPFKDIAGQTGESVATLISRKRYAVLHLRNRLAVLKDELLNY